MALLQGSAIKQEVSAVLKFAPVEACRSGLLRANNTDLLPLSSNNIASSIASCWRLTLAEAPSNNARLRRWKNEKRSPPTYRDPSSFFLKESAA